MSNYEKCKTIVLEGLDIIGRMAFVVAVRRGLTIMIPFMMIGSFAVFINNLPLPPYQHLMLRLFGDNWTSFGGYVYQATFSIMSVMMALTVAHSLTVEGAKQCKDTEINPMIGTIVSLSCLCALLYADNDTFKLDSLGSLGVFVAMVTALISSKLFVFFHRFKKFRLKLYSNAAENHFSHMIVSLFPVVMTILLFVIFRMFLAHLGILDIHVAIYDGLWKLFSSLSSEFSTGIIFVTVSHLFWFFGIHGDNVLEPVAQSIFVPALDINRQLMASGLPPTEIFTKPFFDVFVYMGGSGTTLSLIIAMLFFTRRSNTRQVAKLSLLPALINVNELMIFGVPIVLNFYLFLPFIFIPTILALLSYFAMAVGLVPLTIAAVDWTTPIVMGGYLATGGAVSGAVLQLFNLTVGTLIYIPFLKMYERSLTRDNSRTLQNLFESVLHLSVDRPIILLNKRDAEGNMARELAGDLERDFRAGKLYLHYQPQMLSDNTLYGFEALLRWRHDELGPIPPPIIIAIAEETGLMRDLGNWIFKTAALALQDINAAGCGNIIMSVNITPSQLDGEAMAGDFLEMTKKYALSPIQLEIEITEQAALGGVKRLEVIRNLQAAGFHISMDDFGMGHSSLMYIKDFNLATIKLDGALVKDIETNSSCSEIISSIVYLCRSMNIHIIAEYVENRQQMEMLKNLGCHCYQGYLYSPAVGLEDAIRFAKSL